MGYNRGDIMGTAKRRERDAGMHHSGASTHPESDSDNREGGDMGGGVMAERRAEGTRGKSSMAKAVRHLNKMAASKHYKHKK